MRHISDDEIGEIFDYATRDGFLYARSFPGSGYREFLKTIEQKLRNGEFTVEQAYDYINDFKPSNKITDGGGQ